MWSVLLMGTMAILSGVDPVIPPPPALPLIQPGGQPEGQADVPVGLTTTESETISRQKSPKGRVEAALKLAALRIGNGLMLSQQSQYQSAAQQLETFANLLSYADGIARSIPNEKRNDRETCLKKIEQTIFRQTPRFESIIRDLPLEYQESNAPFAERVKRIRLQAINDLLGGGAAIRVPE